MTTDPAVRAAAQAVLNLGWLLSHDETLTLARAAVEAARPIERATALREAADEIEAIYPADIFDTPSEANAKAALDALRPVGTTPDHFAAAGARIACNLMRDIAARAAVRTEPEQ